MARRYLSALGALVLCYSAGLAQTAGPSPADGPIVPFGPVVANPASEGGGHFDAGAGFYYLKATPGHDPAGTLTFRNEDFKAFALNVTQNTVADFHHDFDFAPLIWLGYTTDSGLGARVRWWRFEDKSGEFAASLPTTTLVNNVQSGTFFTPATAFGTGIGARAVGNAVLIGGFGGPTPVVFGTEAARLHEEIELNVWDFEVTDAFQWHCCRGLVSGGVRYAMLSQEYTATSLGALGPNDFGGVTTSDTDIARAHHDFNAVGPTLALELHRPLGDSGLALYGSARTSLLFGKDKENIAERSDITFTQAGVVGPQTQTRIQSSTAAHDQTVPIEELELGVEWSGKIGEMTPFIRAAAVGQSWIDTGSSSDSHGNLGLFGFTLSTGITY